MTFPAIFTAVIFVLAYAIIATERLHRTVVALAGGMLLILAGILSQEEAFSAIDFNVIFLLVGMMVIADIMSETGVFQWIAVQSVNAGRGRPLLIMAMLCLVTAGASAILDNVTIVVLIAPITLFIASALHVSPIPFLVAEIMSSNIGGAATIIGDPPNILVASAANLDFLTFVGNMLPITLVCLGTLIGILALEIRREIDPTPVVSHLDASGLITDRRLLRQSLVVMGLVLVGFIFHGMLGLEPATIAMAGASLLLIITRRDPFEHLREVEWTTLFFFIGLFIMVEAMVKTGIITAIAGAVLNITKGNLRLTANLLLWFSALFSGIVDNIPYTATLIPLVQQLGKVMPAGPLWWALVMGADFGGNLTLVGASANLVVATVAQRAGYPISFKRYLSYSLISTLAVLLLSTLYLWLRYLL
ncbi:MAG: ArsB/NhaD family transporter [Anaerolineae bacterium]|nr:ArsB/NhaD family transporter [Anaerolineae bacterium]